MNAAQARLFVLVRAHETGEAGTDWTDADRAWASDAALRQTGPGVRPEAWLVQRAALGTQRLADRRPGIAAWLGTRSPGGGALLLLLVLAAAAGVATNLVGPSRRIALLAPALLGLLAWNLAVYGLLAWHGLRPSRGAAPGVLRPLLMGAAARWGQWQRLPTALAAPALQRFAADWLRLAAPLHWARLASALHLAAAVFAAGAVAGLYLRGLVFEFRAAWESTFLGAAQVQQLLQLVLGPAAWVSGQALPTLAQLEALHTTRGPGENAAPWIHLYAITIAAVVLLPRSLLAAGAGWRAARLAQRFPLDFGEPYVPGLWQQFARHGRQPGLAVQVQPVSYQLGEERLPALRAALAAEWGPGFSLQLLPSVGTDAVGPASPTVQTLPLFTMTATPEADTHGQFLRRLLAGAPAAVDGLRPPALVDESGFRRRLAPADLPRRLAERRTAWERLLAAHGHRPLFVDLDALGGLR